MEFGVILALTIDLIFVPTKHEAPEGAAVGVEEPVVGDAELGVPASLGAFVVGLVADADGFDDEGGGDQKPTVWKFRISVLCIRRLLMPSFIRSEVHRVHADDARG